MRIAALFSLPLQEDGMHLVSQVIHEVVRVQVLVLASRSDQRRHGPVSIAELSNWLHVAPDEGAEILHELQEEGLVEVRRAGTGPADGAIYLTPMGRGWIDWMHRQARRRRPAAP